jgi:hypothetical protein
MKALCADPGEIERTISLLLPAGAVIECRIPTERDGVVSGYFNDPVALKKAILAQNGRSGIYLTLNPVLPQLLARCANRLKAHAKVTTGDKDTLRRRFLLLDFDPARPSEISSSEEEHEAALERAHTVMVMLGTMDGWPQGILADSGNGAHVVYGIDLPNDDESAKLIKNVLKALAKRFDDNKVKLDPTVFNAARIVKCWGTVVRKGDNVPERPHRRSGFLNDVPEKLKIVPRERLEAMAATVGEPTARTDAPPPSRGGSFDLEKFISRYLQAREPVAYEGGRKWVLERCPFNPDHQAPDAAVFQWADGAIGFHCFHGSCEGKSWRDVRELVEPRRGHRAGPPPPPPYEQPPRDDEQAVRTNGASNDDWPAPEPLQGELPPVEPFDPAQLPESLRPLVVDVAERMQVPIDFPAAVATLCLAGVVSRRASIQPKMHDTAWIVTPNLWGGIIGRPGLMKSPTLKAIAHPLEQLQALWYQEYQAALADHAREREECDLRQAAWRETYKTATKKNADPPIRPDDSLPEPVLRRLLLNDATYEKAHETMRVNPAGILVIRDELSGWLVQLDRQRREGEREFWLQAWNGDASYVIDRIGRGTIYVPHLCMSLLGGIQPARLRSYLTDALFDGPANDGLMQRFQVLVWPDASAEWLDVDRIPDVRAAEQAACVFGRLVEIDPEEPVRLSFDANAQALFRDWRTALEYKLRSGELHPALESHLAKYRSLNPSLAGLFSLADGAAAGELPSQVSMVHEQQAIFWCGYLESHARRVYSCIVSPQMRAARDLAERIKQRKVGVGGVLSLRDIYLKGWSGLDDPQQAKAAVDVLVDACWLRRSDAGSPDPFGRGRPSDRYAINPRIWA